MQCLVRSLECDKPWPQVVQVEVGVERAPTPSSPQSGSKLFPLTYGGLEQRIGSHSESRCSSSPSPGDGDEDGDDHSCLSSSHLPGSDA